MRGINDAAVQLQQAKAALSAQATPEERIYAQSFKFEYRTPAI